ncbi:MAG: DNA replication/repair protein RecF [Rudaea sp.]
MQLRELRIENLRNITDMTVEFAAGLNVIEGANGAGKTSIVEAAHLLSHGSSFRAHKADLLLRRGAEALSLFGVVSSAGNEHRLGLLRRAGRWQARLDGAASTALSELFATCAVVCFDPGSHSLISGGAEGRRGYLDWGLFHVEPGFGDWSRRYRRALRQRNAVLKKQGSADELAAWAAEMASVAEPITRAREKYIDDLTAALGPLFARLLPELGEPGLRFRPGWTRSEALDRVLAQGEPRDRLLGHCTRGPHRADWTLSFEAAPIHEQLSRGQEKLCAIACLLGQAQLYRRARGEWPIIALDDFCSELDTPHQEECLAALADSGAQILMTGTEFPTALLARFPPSRRFHVEQAKLRALL